MRVATESPPAAVPGLNCPGVCMRPVAPNYLHCKCGTAAIQPLPSWLFKIGQTAAVALMAIVALLVFVLSRNYVVEIAPYVFVDC